MGGSGDGRRGEPAPPLGPHLATLRIPKIGVDQPVVEGTTADQLAGATGHDVGTALPGRHGNVGIVGHRTTHGAPFNRLDELVPGDQLVLVVDGVELQYAVSGSQVVEPTDGDPGSRHHRRRAAGVTVPGQSSKRARRAAALE